MLIKVNDTVLIVVGDDKGVRGKVLSVDHSSRKMVVEGVNRVYKHVARSQKNPQGGRLSKEMPVHSSNVALICPETDQPTRVGVRVLKDGSKERFSKRSGAAMGEVSPPRASRAAN